MIIIINLELDEGDEPDDGGKKLISGYVVHAIFILLHTFVQFVSSYQHVQHKFAKQAVTIYHRCIFVKG